MSGRVDIEERLGRNRKNRDLCLKSRQYAENRDRKTVE